MQPIPQAVSFNAAIQAAVQAGFGGPNPPMASPDSIGGLIQQVQGVLIKPMVCTLKVNGTERGDYPTFDAAMVAAQDELQDFNTLAVRVLDIEIVQQIRNDDGTRLLFSGNP